MIDRANLTRSALFLLLALLCATQLEAAEDDAVARVVISLGTVEAVAADGSVRTLERGDPIYEGDTVRTGPRARAQLRFTDSSRMSIRPASELAVDDYEFQESAPPAQARSALSLRRGGFRTATGRIADRNRSAYRVSTPFAVIGVRGTDWSAAIIDIGEGDNLFLGVDDGGINAFNDGGSIDLGEGGPFDFARIRSFTDMPEGLDSLPTTVANSFRSTPLPPTGDDDDGSAPPTDDGAPPPPPADDGDGQEGGPGAGPEDASGPSGGPDGGTGGGPEVGPDGEVQITGPITSGSGGEGDPLQPVFESGLGCF